jgi:hypothetical protein
VQKERERKSLTAIYPVIDHVPPTPRSPESEDTTVEPIMPVPVIPLEPVILACFIFINIETLRLYESDYQNQNSHCLLAPPNSSQNPQEECSLEQWLC